jgi:hypothetical protein
MLQQGLQKRGGAAWNGFMLPRRWKRS